MSSPHSRSEAHRDVFFCSISRVDCAVAVLWKMKNEKKEETCCFGIFHLTLLLFGYARGTVLWKMIKKRKKETENKENNTF